MARTIKEAWDDYKRHYMKGFEILAKKDIPVYDGAKSTKKVGTVSKGSGVHVKPISGNSYQARIEVIYDNDKTGWISTPMLGKPRSATGKKKMPELKPQEFDIPLDQKMSFETYYKKVLAAIEKRDDLQLVIKEYLKELTEFCMHHGATEKKELVKAYADLAASEYIDIMNNIEKDFSEITAPLCVLERGAAELDKLGYGKLTKKNAQVFLPGAGNEPLIDFMIYDDEDREYPFSVKKISKTTNVVKPQDIISLLDKKKNSKWVKDYKKTVEFKILEVLADNRVKQGSFLALEVLAKDTTLKHKLPRNVVTNIDKMVKGGDPSETDVKAAQAWWLELADMYYTDAKDYWNAPKHSSGQVGIASLICQMALRKISKEGALVYRNVIQNFVMQEVTYYKFATNRGMPVFYMENHLKNNLKPNDEYYLREKSSIGNPYRDKVGVQP
jgi:hypothetical protein